MGGLFRINVTYTMHSNVKYVLIALRIILVWSSCNGTLFAQNGNSEFSGYIQSLTQWGLSSDSSSAWILGNVQNRLQLKWNPNEQNRFRLEIRNRLLWGDLYAQYPELVDQIGIDPSWVDLNFHYRLKSNLIANHTIDRLYWNGIFGMWNVTVGRQRIHWGMHNAWNPNDLFNTHNFLDFDYFERSGTDALRIQGSIGMESSLEFAFHPARSNQKQILGMRYNSHVGTYDIQWISAYFQGEFSFGGAWAGPIGGSLWKTEWSVFTGKETNMQNIQTAWVVATSLEYSFPKQWYVSASILIQSDWSSSTVFTSIDPALSVTPKSLFPSPITGMLQGSKTVDDRWNIQLMALYASENNVFLLYPGITMDAGNQTLLEFRGQLIRSDGNKHDHPFLQNYYLTFKWNF